jgi:hypothetical protein
MSSVTPLFAARAPQCAFDDYLGPGEVTEVRAREVQATLRGGASVSAELALAFPYEPAPGDVLLVAGKGGEHYVIGVLRGSGRTTLAIQGDVELRAVGGSLDLSGDAGVRLHGPELQVYAGKLRMVAGAAIEQFTSLCQRVSALFSVHAGQKHTVVDDDSIEKARSATLLTEETVTINGKQVHLG